MKNILVSFIIVFCLFSFVQTAKAGELTMANDFFSTEKWGTPMDNPVYGKDSVVYYHCYVAGLQAKTDGKFAISGDLLVIGPNGRVHRWAPDLIVENAIESSIFENGLLPIRMNLEMLSTNSDGNYIFIIQITDKTSGKKGAIAKQYTYKK